MNENPYFFKQKELEKLEEDADLFSPIKMVLYAVEHISNFNPYTDFIRTYSNLQYAAVKSFEDCKNFQEAETCFKLYAYACYKNSCALSSSELEMLKEKVKPFAIEHINDLFEKTIQRNTGNLLTELKPICEEAQALSGCYGFKISDIPSWDCHINYKSEAAIKYLKQMMLRIEKERSNPDKPWVTKTSSDCYILEIAAYRKYADGMDFSDIEADYHGNTITFTHICNVLMLSESNLQTLQQETM